ncbi:MAG: tyrosinase family protein [Cyclobacteriaceae bacterium]|jgi:hypothetical protein
MKRLIIARIWITFLLPIAIQCSSGDSDGFTEIEIPHGMTSLYNEIAAYKPVKGSTVSSLDISNLLKNFTGVTQAYVIEFDSGFYYEPRKVVINDDKIPVIPSDKNILVVLDLGEIAQNNYALIADLSRFNEFNEINIQNSICSKILCSPDIFKVDKVFDEIPDFQDFKSAFDFHRGPIGKVPHVRTSSICEKCFSIPSKIFPCIYRKCPVFPFPMRPYVRKNFNTLTAAEKSSFKKGIEEMKLKGEPSTDSWLYQANIHDVPRGTIIRDLYSTCEHGTIHFYTWHRMYLYYFEKIARKASGDNKFTLPYWNYSLPGQERLPIEFTTPADNSNPLYNPDRDNMNDGTSLPPDHIDLSSLDESTFSRFNFGSEDVPHNVVHGFIGGTMGTTRTAGRDPIFWLHHCNLDRLWNKWVQRTGHLNPVDPAWLSTPYDFFDENGVRVTLRVADILNTLDQLNYRYDDDPPAPIRFILARNFKSIRLQQHLGDSVIAKNNRLTRLSEKPARVSINMPQAQLKAMQTIIERNKRTFLVIEGIKAEESVGTNFRIFLNPLDSQNLKVASRQSFVGLLSFFGNHDEGHSHNKEYDITDLMQDLAQKGRLRTADFVFVPVYPEDSKGRKAIKIKGNPQFERISIIERTDDN